ncbi:nonribosomal peptide synthase [Penicillium soppii]|uniref:nonribosomal peptide synthase n=1 Tax=Penicillium soppii TaxID=69789 RepID=UPI002546A284|nr:nonribosomal peptide synthase [Penicillium soppii]KAJ5851866.1 nonribosomal peptide synthase [Penicillium soppii]
MPARFILLSSKNRQQHVFIIRLMHAQWDALSIPDIPAFLYKRAEESRESALRFWREMLTDSTLTPVQTLPGDVEDPVRTLWKNQDISPPPETPG